jgi:hypothetical protein
VALDELEQPVSLEREPDEVVYRVTERRSEDEDGRYEQEIR